MPVTPVARILCGGESSRYGSDKALALHRGKSLLRGVVETLATRYEDIAIVTAPGRDYDIDVQTIPDTVRGRGPLGGLHAALTDTSADAVAVAPCDVIGLQSDWYALLEEQCERHLAAAFFTDRWQPLIAVYRTDLLDEVETRLRAGNLAVRDLLDAYGARVAPPRNFGSLVRVNRPEDLP